jgi:hypothetical protein
LHDLGWIEGRNVIFDIHRPAATPDDIRKSVAEMMAGMPDVIITTGTTAMGTTQCRLFSHPLLIRSAVDLSRAWPSLEEMPRASCS